MWPEGQKIDHHTEPRGSAAANRLRALLLHLFSDDSPTSEGHVWITDRSLEMDQRMPNSEPSIALPNDALGPFPYRRLSEKEKTRLLVLEPGKFGDELRGKLKHVRSLQDHDYEALSYVWGDTSGTHTLECSGMGIRITSNLDAALRTLRFQDKPRTLWVDALCINQKNVFERSRQVRNMQEIYANAKQVLVWLGEESQKDSSAFYSLRQLQHQLTTRDESWFLIRLGWYRDKSGIVFSGGAHRSMLTDIEYDHLIHLLHRDWFRRTWVIQEVASARNATVFCGNQSIPWETLAEVFMRLGDHFLPVSGLGGEEPQHSLENIDAIETARRSQSGPLSMSLFHILVATSFSKCKDQRDKIFAVIGLAKDWVGKRTLVPDYDTTEDKSLEAFRDFAIADSNQNRDLRTLSCACGPSAAPSLRSWVPDWTKIQNPYPFVRYSDRTKFCASGGMKAEAWHSNNESVLCVTGKIVDSITILGSVPNFTKTVAVFEINEAKIIEIEKSFKWLQECQELVLDDKGSLSKSRHEMLWRTLTCGLTGDAFPAPARYSEYFTKYMNFMKTAADRFEDYLTESQTVATEVRGLDDAIPDFETHALIEASLFKWSSRRRMCKTIDGRLACVPRSSEPGDVICTLLGADVPYVLRSMATGFYSVIGECYVDDIMHGESLSHNRMLRTFRLL